MVVEPCNIENCGPEGVWDCEMRRGGETRVTSPGEPYERRTTQDHQYIHDGRTILYAHYALSRKHGLKQRPTSSASSGARPYRNAAVTGRDLRLRPERVRERR